MTEAHNSQIGRRYAEALFNSIPISEQTRVLDEFKQVILILEDVKIKEVFNHPRTSKSHKDELIKLMKLSRIMEDFLRLIVDKSRERFLIQIANWFEHLVLEAQQTTKANVVSAIPLSANILETLKQKLERLTGKKIIIDTKVNPTIGGGMIITVDGKVIDGSVTSALEQFQSSLAN